MASSLDALLKEFPVNDAQAQKDTVTLQVKDSAHGTRTVVLPRSMPLAALFYAYYQTVGDGCCVYDDTHGD